MKKMPQGLLLGHLLLSLLPTPPVLTLRHHPDNDDDPDLSIHKEVLAGYIPERHSVIVPLGGWSKESLAFLCSGNLWVRECF